MTELTTGAESTVALAGQATNPQELLLLQKLDALEAALLAKDPLMPTHLAAIHKQLVTYEELVHFLTDEQIGKIMAAQQVHTNTTLVQSLTSKTGKPTAAALKKTARLGMDDV